MELRNLVTHPARLWVFGASSRDALFATPEPEAHSTILESNLGSWISEAIFADFQSCLPCGIQVLNNIYGALYSEG